MSPTSTGEAGRLGTQAGCLCGRLGAKFLSSGNLSLGS